MDFHSKGENMRKLFLFISMLFTFSAVCSAMVLEDCGNNHYAYPGNCPTYNNNYSSGGSYYDTWNAFAYDENSGAYGVGTAYKSKRKAEKEAVQNCGTSNCKVIASGNYLGTSGYVAGSSNGVIVGLSSRYNSNKDKMQEKTIKKCKDKGGVNCKIIWDDYYGFKYK